MTFETKYDVGDFVEYKLDRNDERTRFGYIIAIVVSKPTAGYALRFHINRVNMTDEHAQDAEIYEFNIIKRYEETK